MSGVPKALAAPVRRYFNPRFESIDRRLAAVQQELARLAGATPPGDAAAPAASSARDAAELRQARLLGRVDVSKHNSGGRTPTFATLQCQAPSAAQCDDPAYLEWCKLLQGWDEPTGQVGQYNRKLWEWAYIAEAVTQAGLMEPGRRALGFGVGNEPMPALFASRGLDVLATDQGVAGGEEWASTGQLLAGLAGLSRPHLIPDAELAARVRSREVDMNKVPDDLGTFEVIWSACSIEHLGSPERGLEFVLDSCRLLEPGGIAVHTTELELTPKATTADYGHCAVYRIEDLVAFADRLPAIGCRAAPLNFTVAMDTPADRWVSLQILGGDDALPDEAHLKLAMGDSVSTSFGLLIRKLP